MPSLSHNQLSNLLQEARQARTPVSVLDTEARQIHYLPSTCTTEDASELAEIALRPPAGTTIYKYGTRSLVGGYQLESGKNVALKYYFPKSIPKKLRYGIGSSRCEQSWLGSIGLHALGIPTPSPLAFFEYNRYAIWNHQSFLATEQAPGIPLHQYYKKYRSDSTRITLLLDSLKQLFDLMAEYRIAHGDLKASNILVNSDNSLQFIDLDSVSFLNTGQRWHQLRARDSSIFLQNWRHDSDALTTFQSAIS
ncbi:hypothetical protein Rhal01_01667 [Rubritalea halochordaticola]|uniref:Non-specific serine/threonine protein kinase n=1 Tax=Rubritalea halochordaticola TaxID=714537 RepID=A0ABP9UYN4_9BACT